MDKPLINDFLKKQQEAAKKEVEEMKKHPFTAEQMIAQMRRNRLTSVKCMDPDGDYHLLGFYFGSKMTGLPVVSLYQEKNKLRFILDSGANNSIIDKSALKSIMYSPTNEKVGLTGLEDTQHVEEMCRIMLKDGDQCYASDFIIKDLHDAFDDIKDSCGLQLHGLLGSNFLRKYHFIMDFNTNSAYSKITKA